MSTTDRPKRSRWRAPIGASSVRRPELDHHEHPGGLTCAEVDELLEAHRRSTIKLAELGLATHLVSSAEVDEGADPTLAPIKPRPTRPDPGLAERSPRRPWWRWWWLR